MATIFYPPTIDYNKLRQRPQQLMSVAAKNGHKVIYCNLTVDTDKRPEEVEPNLFVYHNPKVAVKRNPDIDLLYYTWANKIEYIDLLNPKLSIFDNVDNFQQFEKADVLAVEKSDIVLVASEPLYILRKNQRDDIVLVRNGCTKIEYEKFDRPEQYGDGKVVLFIGAIGKWCDVDLMEKIAKQYRLFVVGEPFGERLPEGCSFMQSVPHRELARYIQHADCCILPFDNSDVSLYSCPIKTYEYLQFGKTVVSTNIPESLYLSEKYPVLISNNHNEFLYNIEKAFKMSKPQEDFTKDFLQKHSWDARWKQIEDIVTKKVYK